MSPPAATLADQQRAFNAFRRVYNEERPQEALGQRPPASLYAPSPRPYPRNVASLEYGSGVEVRWVRSNGEIKWATARWSGASTTFSMIYSIMVGGCGYSNGAMRT